LFSVIFGVPIPILVAWEYAIFVLPAVCYAARGLSFSCLCVFVKRILAICRGEANLQLAGCDSPKCAGCVLGSVSCSVLCDLAHDTHLGLCAQYPSMWKCA
jgi:hypothetical protein